MSIECLVCSTTNDKGWQMAHRWRDSNFLSDLIYFLIGVCVCQVEKTWWLWYDKERCFYPVKNERGCVLPEEDCGVTEEWLFSFECHLPPAALLLDYTLNWVQKISFRWTQSRRKHTSINVCFTSSSSRPPAIAINDLQHSVSRCEPQHNHSHTPIITTKTMDESHDNNAKLTKSFALKLCSCCCWPSVRLYASFVCSSSSTHSVDYSFDHHRHHTRIINNRIQKRFNTFNFRWM